MTSVGSVGPEGASLSAIALSGLRAAALRFDAAANNLANAATEGFVPVHVLGSDLPQGGVRATIATGDRRGGGASPGLSGDSNDDDRPAPTFPPSQLVLDIETPSSTNPVGEVVSVLLARAAFVASLRVLHQDNQVSRRLLELLG
jgi:hypothetical protein